MSNPVKTNFKTEWFSLSLIIIGFLLSYYFFQNFPAQVPSHWNINGEVDAYSGPLMAALMIPILMLVMYIGFFFMPYLDPKKEQYADFSPVYHKFKELFLVFFLILYFLTGLSGLGYKIDIAFCVPVMIGWLFVAIGLLLRKIKMNWFVGIRTPWTLSSETVWTKTNKFGSNLMMIAGVLIAATVLVANLYKIILFVGAVSLMVFATPIYSYILYRQEQKKK